jgi:hypothetical protein
MQTGRRVSKARPIGRRITNRLRHRFRKGRAHETSLRDEIVHVVEIIDAENKQQPIVLNDSWNSLNGLCSHFSPFLPRLPILNGGRPVVAPAPARFHDRTFRRGRSQRRGPLSGPTHVVSVGDRGATNVLQKSRLRRSRPLPLASLAAVENRRRSQTVIVFCAAPAGCVGSTCRPSRRAVWSTTAPGTRLPVWCRVPASMWCRGWPAAA